tara:strand:+ start:392 stop:1030 length:639 start_codon:yes stop_codon:yes gene_type:complete
MKITILLSDKNHPIRPYILSWIEDNNIHNAKLVHSLEDVENGDILFLISCSILIKKEVRDKFKKTFVIHASSLPKGRGWSPHIWAILKDEAKITVSLIEAMDQVDTGDIWAQNEIFFEGHELLDEINSKLFKAELNLMTTVVNNLKNISPHKQVGSPGDYLQKRTPKDSEIDINKSINDQFNILRVVDSERFPAFFIKNGIKYILKITKEKN